MTALGERFRFAEPEPLSDEILEQRAQIDLISRGLYGRMHDLAPEAPKRHWYSVDGVWRTGPKAFYVPDDEEARMAAWLQTTHWRRGYGPSGKAAYSSEVEVSLLSANMAAKGSFFEPKGRGIERVSAVAGRLVVRNGWLFNLNLNAISYESATNVLTDISETLDLIEEVTVK